jgi:bifunctional DNase/RNase
MTKLGMQRILHALPLLLLPLACGAGEARKGEEGMVRVEHVEVRATAMGPVVLLRVQNKAIPIFVDSVVAESIQGALTGQKYPRPLTHDLMRAVLEGLDAKVTRVVITLKGPTYYADLTVLARGTAKVFDSRSSDAIALAVHFNAPMLVSQELIDKAGKLPDERTPSKPGVTL